MVYRLPTNGISTPYLWYIDPLPIVYLYPTHCISTPYPLYIYTLPMVYRSPPYPWYFDPPTHGTLTPLPMVYRPPYP